MARIEKYKFLLLLAAIISIAIDVFAFVGWGISILWIALLINWLLKKKLEFQKIILAISVPFFVYTLAHFIEADIERNLLLTAKNSKFYLPKDRNELLDNPRFEISLLTRSRIIFYGLSDRGAIVVLRSFPFNIIEFNLVDGTRKVRAYD